jgi:para-nitrobenzyl esterase
MPAGMHNKPQHRPICRNGDFVSWEFTMKKDKLDSSGRQAVMTGSRRRFLQSGALLAVQASLGASAVSLAGETYCNGLVKGNKEVIADTTYGKVRGFQTPDGVKTFRGIPYGADTSGKNRFMPPRKPAPWAGVRDAMEWGSVSPQMMSTSLGETQMYLGGPTEGRQGEDCLALNVWTTQQKGAAKLPVYVRIHGGGYSTGSGNRPLYIGHNAAKRGVVYVSMNHRLDILGYMDLSKFGGQFEQSGNAGLLDLVLMLEWVRDNIENFGGDPSRVMIAGESGGGSKVSTLLGTAPAQGLFHRAVIESGPALTARSRDDSSSFTDRYLAHLGVDKSKIADVQSMPFTRLFEAYFTLMDRRWHPQDKPPQGNFSPVVDGTIIPQKMFEPTATTLSASIPLIIGHNKDEGTFFRQSDSELYALDDAGLKSRVAAMVGAESADKVIAVYRGVYPAASPSQLMIQMGTDTSMGVRSASLAERKADLHKAPVYMFRFDWPSPCFDGRFGATHGLEIPFVTDNISEMQVMTHDLPEAHALSAKMMDTWISFATTGDPNNKSIPRWRPYSSAERTVMLFDNEIKPVGDPHGAEIRKLWSTLTVVRT